MGSGRAAILDIDGTLVDTNYQHALAWYMAFRQHEILLPVWRIHRHVGMGGDQLVAALAGDGVERQVPGGGALPGSARRPTARRRLDYLRRCGADQAQPRPGAGRAREARRRGGRDGGRHALGRSGSREGGVPTIAVLTGGFSADELLEAGASNVFESIGELREALSDTPLS